MAISGERERERLGGIWEHRKGKRLRGRHTHAHTHTRKQRGGSSSRRMGSFEFAFNNPKYSDRVLRLIVSDARKTAAARLENSSSNNNSMKEGGEMVSAALRPLKRRRCHSPPASAGPTTGLELLCQQQQSTAAASISSDAVCEFLDDPGKHRRSETLGSFMGIFIEKFSLLVLHTVSVVAFLQSAEELQIIRSTDDASWVVVVVVDCLWVVTVVPTVQVYTK